MVPGKQTLLGAFETAQVNFHHAFDAKRKHDLGRLCEEAWNARHAMAESGLFSVAEIMKTNESLETISAVTTLSREPSSEVKAFYARMASKTGIQNKNEFNG